MWSSKLQELDSDREQPATRIVGEGAGSLPQQVESLEFFGTLPVTLRKPPNAPGALSPYLGSQSVGS